MRKRHPAGFTLVELLVVIGIIAVLAGLLLPAVNKVYINAQRTAQASTLQSIATALEAYNQDWHDYPRVRMAGTPNVRADYSVARSSPDQKERPNPQTGAEVLCFALMGLARASDPAPVANYMSKQDGADGPGFRVRQGSKIYPPYLAPDQFKTGQREDDSILPADAVNYDKYVLHMMLLDKSNMPILYFPASPTKPNVTIPPVPATSTPPYVASTYVNAAHNSELSRYDADDNLLWFNDDPFGAMTTPATFGGANALKAYKRIVALLGDRYGVTGPATFPYTPNAVIQPGETAVDLPFLLWAAGPDERFGPGSDKFSAGVDLSDADIRSVEKCDDVTNFMR